MLQRYENWLNFIVKTKKIKEQHVHATKLLPPGSPKPDWNDIKEADLTAPDGQQYVIYYAEKTAKDKKDEEEEQRRKISEKEDAEEKAWRDDHNEGKFVFKLDNKQNDMSRITTPILLERDAKGNRWYIKKEDYYIDTTENHHAFVNGLVIEGIERKHRRGHKEGLREFLKNPGKFTFYVGGAPQSVIDQAKKYAAYNYVTKTLDSGDSDMDPNVGSIRVYKWGNDSDRYESLKEKSKKMEEPLIIDWNNPSKENLEMITKSRHLEGHVDAIKFETNARYQLWNLRRTSYQYE